MVNISTNNILQLNIRKLCTRYTTKHNKTTKPVSQNNINVDIQGKETEI